MTKLRLLSVVLAATVAATAAGCSRDDGPAASPGGTLTPQTTGDVCNDPKGDLSTDTKGAGTLAEPAGIDIVKAEAALTDATLKVTFTTAGPIALVPEPIFVVEQGVPGRDVSFELRAEPASVGGPWQVSVVTFRAAEQRTQLTVPVTVSNNTLTFEVARKDLPPVATLLWQFGTSSGNPDAENATVVFDDCNNFSDGQTTTTSTPGSTVPATAAPTTTAPPPVPVGTSQTGADGPKVTVHEVRAPFTPKTELAIKPDDGNAIAVVDLEVCATKPNSQANIADVRLKTADNRQWQPWVVPQTVLSPAFPSAQVLSSGDCVRGWVPVQYTAGSKVSEVLFDLSAKGRGPFLTWTVP